MTIVIVRRRSWSACLLMALGLLLLVACAPPERASLPADEEPAGRVSADAQKFLLIPGESWVRILVYRDGALAALGHNHVISTTAISGQLAVGSTPARSAISFEFPLSSLSVDLPELRDAEGDDFPGELDQASIDGTRANMLGEKVLAAARFPAIQLRSHRIAGDYPDLSLLMDVTVREQTTRITVPATVTANPTEIVAEGSLKLRQTELGLVPFSVAFGALSVRDEMQLKFRLLARAVPD
ncbi:MAG: YceI family protein [Gammaproteobacteria bacterium]